MSIDSEIGLRFRYRVDEYSEKRQAPEDIKKNIVPELKQALFDMREILPWVFS